MFKHFSLFLAALLATAMGISAQVQNYALQLDAAGSAECGQMPQIDGLDSYTVQMWINPSNWSEGAVLYSRGETFKAALGAPGSVVFTVGDNTLTATSEALAAGKWNQLTLRSSHGTATAMVNLEEAGKVKLGAIPSSSDEFVIGGSGYQGRIDEMRIWACAVSADYDYYAFNTLNKFMPQYDKLVAYYKMDQELCEHLVEYKTLEYPGEFCNHGLLTGGAKKVAVDDNDRLPYLINSAYTANERFFDRVIPRDQYLLSNDIINLGIQSYADGHLEYVNPDNPAKLRSGAKVLDEFEGRKGVLSLDGKGFLEGPASTMKDLSNYAFETWFLLDEWVEGARLFTKETSDKMNGIAIELASYQATGEENKPCVIVRINGNNWRYPVTIENGKWYHFGMSVAGGNTAGTAIRVALDGKPLSARSKYHDGGTDYVINGNADQKAEYGRLLKGKMDEVAVWNKAFASFHMDGMPMVTLDQPYADAQTLMNGDTYYTFDNPEDPGFDYYSNVNWLRIMKSAFDGYRGAKFYVSVKTPSGYNDSNLVGLINNANWRKKFAEDLAVLSVPFDGVELDLEWVYTWTSYGLLAKEIREKLPEGKIFRVSTHNVTYKFPLDKMEYVDGFTFQQYGPQKGHFTYSGFENYCKAFVDYGYPRNKIMTSYSTTTSNGSNGSPIKGVKDGFMDENYTPNGETASKVFGSETFWFTDPLQTYKRAKYTRENNLQGIFYWDMGNDIWDKDDDGNPVMSKWNLARWCSYALNSNVDRLVTEVDLRHLGGVQTVGATSTSGSRLEILPSDAATLRVRVAGQTPEAVKLFVPSGAMALDSELDITGAADVSALAPGLYIVSVTTRSGAVFSGKFIKK